MKNNQYIYSAKVVRVIDGDTIEVEIDLGFTVTCKIPVRLAHINANERNQIGGSEATAHLTALLSGQFGFKPIVLQTYKPRDKYGRYLADILIGDINVNSLMVADGFAVPYDGGKRSISK